MRGPKNTIELLHHIQIRHNAVGLLFFQFLLLHSNWGAKKRFFLESLPWLSRVNCCEKLLEPTNGMVFHMKKSCKILGGKFCSLSIFVREAIFSYGLLKTIS